MSKFSDLIHKHTYQLMNVLIIFILLISQLSVSRVLAAGEAGWALSFDGVNDYVALGITDNIIGVDWKTTKSISVWIRPTGSPKVCNYNDVDDVAFCDAVIVNQPHFFGIARGIVNGEDRIWVWNYDGTTTRIGVPYEVDQWVNITLVHSNGFLKLYRNGNLINSVSSGATFLDPQVGETKLQIGAFLKEGVASGAFQGLIDEVRIYSTEISEQTISDTLRTNLVGDEPGLEAYYQMSDGSGYLLTDDSVNNWTGTLMDGTPYVPSNDSYPLWVNSSAFDYPVADDQSVTLLEDEVDVPITLTGSSPNSSELTYQITEYPVNGSLSGTAPNLTYTPNPNFHGSDQFLFYINDTTYDSSLATVSIAVDPVNDQPSAVPQALDTDEDTSLDITLNGTDVDLTDVLTFEIVSNPSNGELTGAADEWTYQPDTDYSGTDQFSFRVYDGSLYSAAVAIDITINPINDLPVADSQTLITDEDTDLTITLTGQDADGNPLTYRITSQPSEGTLTGSGASRVYHPDQDFHGSDSFMFVVNDTFGDSLPATISITVSPTNDAPTATDDSYQVNMHAVLNVAAPGVLENDNDIDGDLLTTDLVMDVQNGSLILNLNGSFSYSPDPGYFGSDSFTYRVTDGSLNSNTVTAQIEVLQVTYYTYLPIILK
jgi:hypothetical protein